jgi:SAM-dependent methyltransferase
MSSSSGHNTALDYHRMLLDDPVRMDAYDRAIRALVHRGDVVLDLGTGTGVLAMLAARRGARVHAVESMEIAGLARGMVVANGLEDRVTVHHADFRSLEPIEAVDLVLTDCMGRFLVDDEMLDVVEAAAKWMKPTARFSPGEIRLFLSPVGDFPLPVLDRFHFDLYGLDLSPATDPSLNWCYASLLPKTALLAAPEQFYQLCPPTRAAPFAREMHFSFERPGVLRAVAGWFEADLADEISLSTAPGIDTHWGQYLFPLQPRTVKAGDELVIHLSLDEDTWHWHGHVAGTPFRHRSEQQFNATQAALPCQKPLGREQIIEANRQAALEHQAGNIELAFKTFKHAIRSLGPGDDDLALPLYENLGLAWMARGMPQAAMSCFFRALDGKPTSRQQSLHYLVIALAQSNRRNDFARFLELYEGEFGPHSGVIENENASTLG